MRLGLSIDTGQTAFISLLDQPNNMIAQVQDSYVSLTPVDLDFSAGNDMHNLIINASGVVAPIFYLTSMEFFVE